MTLPDVDRLAEITAQAAPPLDAATLNRLRDLIAPALRETAEVAAVVALSVAGDTEAPGVAA